MDESKSKPVHYEQRHCDCGDGDNRFYFCVNDGWRREHHVVGLFEKWFRRGSPWAYKNRSRIGEALWFERLLGFDRDYGGNAGLGACERPERWGSHHLFGWNAAVQHFEHFGFVGTDCRQHFGDDVGYQWADGHIRRKP